MKQDYKTLIKSTYPEYVKLKKAIKDKLANHKSLGDAYYELNYGNVTCDSVTNNLNVGEALRKRMIENKEDPSIIEEELNAIDVINAKFNDVEFFISDSWYCKQGLNPKDMQSVQTIRDHIPTGPESFKVKIDDLEVNWYFLIALATQKLLDLSGVSLELVFVKFINENGTWKYVWTQDDLDDREDIKNTVDIVVSELNKLGV